MQILLDACLINENTEKEENHNARTLCCMHTKIR